MEDFGGLWVVATCGGNRGFGFSGVWEFGGCGLFGELFCGVCDDILYCPEEVGELRQEISHAKAPSTLR